MLTKKFLIFPIELLERVVASDTFFPKNHRTKKITTLFGTFFMVMPHYVFLNESFSIKA